MTAPAMSVSRLYQVRNSETISSSPQAAATSSPTCGRFDSMAATLGRQAAATAAPVGSSKSAAASRRISSIASVAGER